jgi:hypothetical protein
MKPGMIQRLEVLEQAADIGPRTHIVWTEAGTDVKAEIAARVGA